MIRLTRRAIALVSLIAGLCWPVAAASPQQPPAGTAPIPVWRIDPARSDVRFTVTKFGFDDVTGVFRESEGEIRFDPARIESGSIEWRVRVASVRTDASSRDRSLQSEEYFDAARSPYLGFVSRAVRAAGSGDLDVAGDITIRGITRPITVKVHPGGTDGGPTFTADFEVDRYDFGVVGGSFFGRLIGAKVRVHLMAATVALGNR